MNAKLAMWSVLAALAIAGTSARAQSRQLRFPLAPGGSVTVRNPFGSVVLSPAAGNEVIVAAKPHSSKVEVDESHAPNRVDLTSHVLQNGSADEGSVDYEVQVPAGATVEVHSSTGNIRVDKAGGDFTLESESGTIEVHDAPRSHLRLQTVNGGITVANASAVHLVASSVGGNIQLTDVAGPSVSADTNSGAIQYRGDCSGGGDYALSTHSGDITAVLPATASLDLTARSLNGSVQNDLPLQPMQHTAMALAAGKSLAGRANSGASSVRLRSFSGTIRVQKQ